VRRIPFLQRLAVVGVWAPLLVLVCMALLWAISSSLWKVSPSLAGAIGGVLVFPGFYLVFALAHVLAFCGLLSLLLWLARKSIDPKLTIVSAGLGLLLGAPILVRIYFNVQLL
jgi:hypothetical protein